MGGRQWGVASLEPGETRGRGQKEGGLKKKKNICNDRKHIHQFDKQPTAHATSVFWGGGGVRCEKLWLVLFVLLMFVAVLFVIICVFPGVKLICVSVVCILKSCLLFNLEV